MIGYTYWWLSFDVWVHFCSKWQYYPCWLVKLTIWTTCVLSFTVFSWENAHYVQESCVQSILIVGRNIGCCFFTISLLFFIIISLLLLIISLNGNMSFSLEWNHWNHFTTSFNSYTNHFIQYLYQPFHSIVIPTISSKKPPFHSNWSQLQYKKLKLQQIATDMDPMTSFLLL